ncbi:T9SS type A sorting domain-containing protein [Mangrovibacterium lignilyticum]|uniref:T9SS type A sorting domain-containing protein n=1 Tax=Mangrovibacterium lignilyticum TaxID=2668052 RepID=UPI0013D70DE4|nr:T9SS type A sorting domain-containing protein [Mangrovibacterium lignilyticum]
MKLLLSCIFGLILSVSVNGQKKSRSPKIHIHTPVCYASDEVHKVFVPAPAKSKLKSAQLTNATINVTYVGFSTEAKDAFAYAVSIWEGLIASPVTINMLARWTPLETSVLGSCSPTDYLENFDGAPFQDYYYPIPLAEKLAGKELNLSTEFDITAQFNSINDNWYFGTDGNTPTDKYDFVSVVLHEITHGLGFTGLCYETTAGLGAYGWISDHPGIFDDYMVNLQGAKLVDQTLFPNYSAELLDEFESGYIEFHSEWAKSQLNDTYPKLYAPVTYDEGSSLYHLNENTYFPGNENSLMTPNIGRGEAIHDPGKATLAMFSEMGWVYTSIQHNELADTEDTASPLQVDARVVSDKGLDSTSVKLIYTDADFSVADTVSMNWEESTDFFSAQIPVSGEAEIKYYIAANDEDGRTYRLPALAPLAYFNVLIGVDQTPPGLSHEPVKILMENDPLLTIHALATDNIGLAGVQIEYAANNQPFQSSPLTESNGEYSTAISFEGLTDGDSIRYRLIATDSSSQSLTDTLPAKGYFVVSVEGFYDPVSTYANNFNTSDRDFISTDFYTATPEGFDNGNLNSSHPYSSPGQNDASYDFTTILKHPIVLEENGEMSFNEVVLVEPGETGSVYGDEGFYDYVIAEASLDGATNWLPLLDGYDSSANTSWLTRYNSAIEGDNSTATGDKALYISRTISLTQNGNFSAGQTVYIRFRLFSDPFANGWGWAIDDLLIQDPGTAVATIKISPGEVIFFPNPVKNQLTIQGNLQQVPGTILLSLFSNTGQKLIQRQIDGSTRSFNAEIDLSSFRSGIYLVNLQFESGQLISRKIIHD